MRGERLFAMPSMDQQGATHTRIQQARQQKLKEQSDKYNFNFQDEVPYPSTSGQTQRIVWTSMDGLMSPQTHPGPENIRPGEAPTAQQHSDKRSGPLAQSDKGKGKLKRKCKCKCKCKKTIRKQRQEGHLRRHREIVPKQLRTRTQTGTTHTKVHPTKMQCRSQPRRESVDPTATPN